VWKLDLNSETFSSKSQELEAYGSKLSEIEVYYIVVQSRGFSAGLEYKYPAVPEFCMSGTLAFSNSSCHRACSSLLAPILGSSQSLIFYSLSFSAMFHLLDISAVLSFLLILLSVAL
jgi:hypothetical protein